MPNKHEAITTYYRETIMDLINLHSGSSDKLINDNKDFVMHGESRIGGRAENQDSMGARQTELGYLVTVCDGMGGGPGGKTASSIAVSTILSVVDKAGKDDDPKEVVTEAIKAANDEILSKASEDKRLYGMGSTATVILLSEKSAIAAHVGDSRIYQTRGHKKVFRTFDHSVVFNLVKQGVITEEQARLSEQSNIITRALGVGPEIVPETVELPYEKGDRFALCSDGIHGALPEKEFIKMLSDNTKSLGAITDDIATCVDNIGRTNGGHHDNLTIIMVEPKINSKIKPKMSKTSRKIFLVLAAICALSILLNVFFIYGGTTGKGAIGSDSLNAIKRNDSIKSDSIKKLNDTISFQKEKLKYIENIIKK